MSKEKVILSFIAVLVGLFVAGVAFFLYQSTKKIPETEKQFAQDVSPTPIKKKNMDSFPLTIDAPKDGSVAEHKTITVAGKTDPHATVIISTELEDDVATPTTDGSFTTTVNLADGENQITITAIGEDGRETSVVRVVTFSTESF